MQTAPDRLSGEYLPVSFEQLTSFRYEVPQPEQFSQSPWKDQVPQAVKQLDNKKISVEGFMLPTAFEKTKVLEFMLLADQTGCCFGIAPPMNGWILVKMVAGKPVQYEPDVPLTVWGTIHIGEEIKDGSVASLYRLDGERTGVSQFHQ